MADSVEVHFKLADNTPVRAVFTPGGKVKAALILPQSKRQSFAADNKLKFDGKPAIPAGVEIKHKDDKNNAKVTVDLNTSGPGVCYWVEEGPEKTLVCW